MDEELQKPTEEEAEEDVLLEWEFNEYERPERSKKWYLVAGLAAIAFLIYALLARNYIFGVIIILVALIYFLYDLHEAPTVQFAITPAGVHVGRKFIRHRDIAHFWIVYKPGHVKALYLRPSIWTTPQLSIPLEEQDPLQVRGVLLQYVPENLNEEDEPVSEALGRML
ncbi:MAG: hypothetical protein AAB579_00940, partial [Patescibacteria group bacterium]